MCHVAYTQCRHCHCHRYGCCVAKIINDAPRTCIKNKAQKNADSQRLRLPIKAEHKAELTNRTPASGMSRDRGRSGGRSAAIECCRCRCCPQSLLLLLAFYVCRHNAAAGKTNNDNDNDSDSAINVSCTGCQLGQTKQQTPKPPAPRSPAIPASHAICLDSLARFFLHVYGFVCTFVYGCTF